MSDHQDYVLPEPPIERPFVGAVNPLTENSNSSQALPSQPVTAFNSAFVFTVTSTLAAGTNAAPTLEASDDKVLVEMKARIRTTSSSGNVVITPKLNGVAIGTITILQGSLTGLTVAPSSAITFKKNDTVDIDITNAGTGAKDLSVFIRVK
jgi:hypothetical protein